MLQIISGKFFKNKKLICRINNILEFPYKTLSSIPLFNLKNNVLLFLPFLSFALLVLIYYPFPNYINVALYGPIILSIDLAIAIFAINFSFLIYQMSPYRFLIHNISYRQLIDPVSILLLSLFPIFFLIIEVNYAATISIATIPMVAYGSILLTMSLKNKADPINLIHEKISNKSLNSFLNKFSNEIQEQLNEIDEMELVKLEDSPWHEFINFKTTPPAKLEDPLNFLSSLGISSIKRSDIYVFENVIQAILETSEVIAKLNIDYKIKNVIYDYFNDIFVNIATYTFKYDILFPIKFLDICALFLRKNAFEWTKNDKINEDMLKLMIFILDTMIMVTEKVLERGDLGTSKITITIARQIVQKGIDVVKNNDNELLIRYIPLFSNLIIKLGFISIKIGESGYLYHCIRALGWIGCSAVKTNNLTAGESCLYGLVKLGRESKRNNLQCFSTSCPLTPFGHAEEGIEWMSSWVHGLKDTEQKSWVEYIGKAYSRLEGVKISIELIDNDEECKVNKIISVEKYIEEYIIGNKFMKYDYSDIEFDKERPNF